MPTDLPSVPLRHEVERIVRWANAYRLAAFAMAGVALVLTASIVYLAVSVPWWYLPCLLPPIYLIKPLWRQSRRTWGFVRAALAVRSGEYVLYLRGSDADDDPREPDWEDSLVRALETVGPTVILDDRQWVRRSSAIRIPYFATNESWVDQVGLLADNARLVVLRLGPRRGYRQRHDTIDDHRFGRAALDGVWLELEVMPEEHFRGKCLVYIGDHCFRAKLQLTNANGSLHFGETTLIDEIRNFVPRTVTEYWPDFRTSRWLWFDPAGRARPLGSPRWVNTPNSFRLELGDLLHFHGKSPLPRESVLWSLLPFGLVGLAFAFLRSALDYISANPTTLIPAGVCAATLLFWLGRRARYHAYILKKYGPYENFVWPMYMYGRGESRPKRRDSGKMTSAIGDSVTD